MKNVIDKLYAEYLCENEEHKKIYGESEEEKREKDAFENLSKLLTGKELTMFHSYEAISYELQKAEHESAFRNGFTAGALLMIEIFSNT